MRLVKFKHRENIVNYNFFLIILYFGEGKLFFHHLSPKISKILLSLICNVLILVKCARHRVLKYPFKYAAGTKGFNYMISLLNLPTLKA